MLTPGYAIELMSSSVGGLGNVMPYAQIMSRTTGFPHLIRHLCACLRMHLRMHVCQHIYANLCISVCACMWVVGRYLPTYLAIDRYLSLSGAPQVLSGFGIGHPTLNPKPRETCQEPEPVGSLELGQDVFHGET